MRFWKELRRRHIVRIAAVYAATAWLVLQLGAIVFPALHAPSWCLPVLIGFVALGFPVALVLAWAFEMTPQGVRRTEAGDSDEATSPNNRRRVGQVLNVAIIVLLAAAVGVLAWRLDHSGNAGPVQATVTATRAPAPSTAIPANSIAVLPFLDLSPKGNQAYFAEGVSEQLLDILAQSTTLKVAARTSAFQFKGKPENVTKIGRILRVRHVLEGSVRRDGDLVRITVQLIDARTDYHEWSKTYQRKMTDIFKVQDDISKAIADALEVRFSNASGTSAVAKADPVTSPAAYDQYLLGRQLLNRRTGKSLREALTHFKKAVKLDPGYAPAYAQIAITYSLLTKGTQTYGNYTGDEANALAKPYLDKAVSLAPDAPETQAAQGRYDVLAHRDHASIQRFSRAVKGNPSYMDAATWLAEGYQAQGQYQNAVDVYRSAIRRDPLNWLINDNYMDALLNRNRFDQATSIARRFMNLYPARAQLMLGEVEFARGEPIASLKHYLTAMNLHPNGQTETEGTINVLIAAGLYEDAHRLRVWDDGGALAAFAGDRDEALRQVRLSLDRHANEVNAHGEASFVYLILGNHAEALQQLNQTWRLSESQHQDIWDFLPGDLTYAALLQETGDTGKAKEALLQLRKRVRRLRANAQAAGVNQDASYWLEAGIKILSGDKTSGLEDLMKVVKQPGLNFPSQKNLDWAPQFDSVRNSPRFKAIVKLAAERQAKIRAEILPVLCNWHYPSDGWHPLPSTCKGVPQTSSTGH